MNDTCVKLSNTHTTSTSGTAPFSDVARRDEESRGASSCADALYLGKVAFAQTPLQSPNLLDALRLRDRLLHPLLLLLAHQASCLELGACRRSCPWLLCCGDRLPVCRYGCLQGFGEAGWCTLRSQEQLLGSFTLLGVPSQCKGLVFENVYAPCLVRVGSPAPASFCSSRSTTLDSTSSPRPDSPSKTDTPVLSIVPAAQDRPGSGWRCL